MQNLDKYFRDNLGKRNFEMKDAYWHHAQKLLEENERRRRRKILWWWSGGGLFAVALVVGIFFLYPSENNGNIAGQDLDKTELENNRSETQAGGVDNENNLPQIQFEEKGNISPEINKKNVQNGNILSENSGEKIKTENEKIAGNDNSEKNIFEKNNSIDNAEIGGENLVNKTGVENKLPGIYPNINNGKIDGMNLKNNREIQHENKPKEGLIVAENESDISENRKEEKAEKLFKINAPGKISALTIFVEKDKVSELELPEAEQYVGKKWTLGFSAAQYFQPTPKSNEQSAIAYRAGVLFKYDWSEKNDFYLLTGLNYQRRTGTFERSKLAETRNYRFGLEVDTNMLRPSAIHSVSLPLLIGKEKGRHVIETGINLNYMTGIYGERGSIERIEGNPPRRDFVPSESGWIAEDGFKRWTAAGQINYRFQVNTQWAFGVSANYTFGGILENNENINPVVLKEDDRFMFGLQAVYFLK